MGSGRHQLNDAIMRAAAVLVVERRALVFRYGDVGADFALALHGLVLVCSLPCREVRVGVQIRRCGQ